MIKGATSSSPHIVVSGGMTGHPYISPGAQSAGMLRWNTNSNVIEVYNGNSWTELTSGYINVGLSGNTETILRWAEQKMIRERELVELAEKNESVRLALENVRDAEEKLEVIAILAK
jgi:hypothetical protein